jgi:hypothetical protein
VRGEEQVAEQPRGTDARPVDGAATDLRQPEPTQSADSDNVLAQEE